VDFAAAGHPGAIAIAGRAAGDANAPDATLVSGLSAGDNSSDMVSTTAHVANDAAEGGRQ